MCRKCQECLEPLGPELRKDATFCTPACRVAFNNRRAVRGAELYDLFMSLRYDREKATALGVWAFVCKLAQSFKEEDDRFAVASGRSGFKSWSNPTTVMARKPWLNAIRARV